MYRNCAAANQISIVEWLSGQGYQPQKIRDADHWYLSPFRKENEASFKISKNKNVWYDHGLGKGGQLVDFVMEFYHCNTSEALQKIVPFHQQNMQEKTAAKPILQNPEKAVKKVAAEDENRIIITSVKQTVMADGIFE